jgi:hypothetical protein
MALTVSAIDAAISAVNSAGQSYTIGDRTFQRGDLETLRKMRLDAIATERSTGKTIFQRVRFGKVGA